MCFFVFLMCFFVFGMFFVGFLELFSFVALAVLLVGCVVWFNTFLFGVDS